MNSETMQTRRRRKQTNDFILLVVALLVLFFGSFFLLRPVLKPQNSPIATTQRFIGFIELKQYDEARRLMTPAFQNVPGWHGMLYSLNSSIDPSEAGYHVLNQQGDVAQVQFSNEQGGYLYLKKVDGKWLIASPNEVPQAQSQSPSGAGTSGAATGGNGSGQ